MVADKSIVDYLEELARKFDELRQDAIKKKQIETKTSNQLISSASCIQFQNSASMTDCRLSNKETEKKSLSVELSTETVTVESDIEAEASASDTEETTSTNVTTFSSRRRRDEHNATNSQSSKAVPKSSEEESVATGSQISSIETSSRSVTPKEVHKFK